MNAYGALLVFGGLLLTVMGLVWGIGVYERVMTRWEKGGSNANAKENREI